MPIAAISPFARVSDEEIATSRRIVEIIHHASARSMGLARVDAF